MKSKIENITPALAASILKTNEHNRNIRQAAVDQYATEMLAGRWAITHQGIAIGEHGKLLDGQHRLLAVQQSGVTVPMLVSKGVPENVNENGVFTMDVIDNGRKRTTADQLHLMHGVDYAQHTAAAIRIIGIICAGQEVKNVSVGQAKEVLAIYGKEIDSSIKTLFPSKPVRRAGVYGSIAFFKKVGPALMSEFATALAAGEGLKSGDPALALRNHLINRVSCTNGTRDLQSFIEWVGNAAFNYVNGSRLTVIRRGMQGLDFFKSKQRANVEKIRGIFGAE